MKNDSSLAGFSHYIFFCQACIIRPSCNSTLHFNQGEFLDMEFCESCPTPILAPNQLTPSLEQIFKQVPQVAHKFVSYSVAEVRQSVHKSVRLELAELPNMKLMSAQTLQDVTSPIAQYYSSTSPATFAAFSWYLPRCTAILFSFASITLFLLSFCNSFNLFRRQWRRPSAHHLKFFRGTSGRFLRIVYNPSSSDSDTSFFYLSNKEIEFLRKLFQKTLRHTEISTALAPSTYSTVNQTDPNDTNHLSCPPIVPDSV